MARPMSERERLRRKRVNEQCEARWRARGMTALHVWISRDADDALQLLCVRYGLTQREVIEQLLIDALPGNNPRGLISHEMQKLMDRHGLSSAEARYFMRSPDAAE